MCCENCVCACLSSQALGVGNRLLRNTKSVGLTVSAELPADCAQACRRPQPSNDGPTREHHGPLCSAAGGLGGPEDGSLSPDIRAGNSFQPRVQQG